MATSFARSRWRSAIEQLQEYLKQREDRSAGADCRKRSERTGGRRRGE